MKALLLTFLMLLSVASITAQEINWISIEEAEVLQKKSPKKIIMDMYTVWCGPCKMLDRNTFKNKDVASYVNKHYYAVKFNAEGNDVITYNGKEYANPNYDPAKAKRRNSGHQLAGYFGVRSFPTMVFIAENGDFIAPIIGYKTPQQLELYLKMFKEDTHKILTTQESFNAYYEAFTPEFRQ
jgi:thioredoxin-related protein